LGDEKANLLVIFEDKAKGVRSCELPLAFVRNLLDRVLSRLGVAEV
jgi:hypothetical protein